MEFFSAERSNFIPTKISFPGKINGFLDYLFFGFLRNVMDYYPRHFLKIRKNKFLTISIIMTEKPYTKDDKIIIACIASLLFIAVSSPYFYSITNAILSGGAISSKGHPSTLGLLIHGILFGIIVLILIK